MSAPERKLTFGQKIKQQDDQNVEFYGLIRQKLTTPLANNVPVSGEGSPSPATGSGFLRTVGDTMIGPIAYYPGAVTISADIIDLAQATAGGYHSLVIVNGQGGVNDDLKTILNATFAGQILLLQTVAGQTITLKHLFGGGNIRLSTGADIMLTPQTTIQLYFDSVANQWADVVGYGSTGAGAFANTMLSNLVATAINVSLLPNVDATLDLGSSLKSWDSLFIGKVRFDDAQSAPTGSSANLIQYETGAMDFNVDVQTDSYFWYFNGVLKWSMNQFTLAGANLILSDTLTINNSGADPLSDGQFTRNLTDVKVYSGGAVRNLSTIGTAGGANTALSNLASTSINQTLLPDTDATKDLGSDLKSWDSLFIGKVRFSDIQSDPTGTSDDLIQLGSDGIQLNVDIITDVYRWFFNGVNKWVMSQFTLTGDNIILNDTLTINNSALDPSTNGQFTRNVNDVKVFSGGAVRNLSNISAIAGATVALDNLAGVAINVTLLPALDATIDLGSDLKSWDSLFIGKVRFSDTQSDPTSISDDLIQLGSSGMQFNLDIQTQVYEWWFNGVLKWTMSQFLVSGDNIILSTSLTLNDAVSFPGSNGAIYREGSDVKIFSGGVERNVSTFGTGSQTPWLSPIDANQFDLTNIKDIKGRDTGASGSFRIVFDANEDSDTYIGDLSATDSFNMVANNIAQVQVSPTGFSFLNNVDMNLFYIQFDENVAPATPPLNEVRMFLNNANGQLSVRKDDGSIVSLEAGGSGILWSTPVNANIIPDADNTRDLGSPASEFRDLFIDGIAQIDFLQVDVGATFLGNVSCQANLTVTGNFLATGSTITFGNSATDDIIFVGGVASNILPDSPVIRDIGAFTNKFGNIYMRGIGHGEPTNQGGLGFFGKALITRRTVNQASGGDSLLTLIGKFNTLLAALGPSTGYNLINVV